MAEVCWTAMPLRPLSLALVLCLSVPALAQPARTIAGHVVDESGAALPDTEITVRTADGIVRARVVSDASGRFETPALSAGTYLLEASKTLFEAQRQSVDLGIAIAPLQLVLKVAGLREDVLVAVPKVDDRPAGQTVTIDRGRFRNSRGFSIGDIAAFSPGVTFVQANGPRDVSISIRGSNARTAFGIRNIQLFEDGFPVTQPDGTSRTDSSDPHVYGAIDVVRGPSSSLYGNYATGGAINMRTRAGRDIAGFEVGVDGGSFDTRNAYALFGHKARAFEIMAFASHAAGHRHTAHTSYSTTTENVLATYTPSPNDKFTFKFLNNDLSTDLSIRLSMNQFNANPFQEGCSALSGLACASVGLFVNGFNGARVNVSPEQADLGRQHVRRTVIGARWERSLNARTTWRTQVVFDNRDLKEPTGATAAVNTSPAFNVTSDVTSKGSLFGRDATHFIGMFANRQDINSYTYNVTPAGNGTLGGLTASTLGDHTNFGLRAREEIAFSATWTAALGIGVERTLLDAVNTAFAYPAAATPTTAMTAIDRRFTNIAPEAAIFFRPNRAWQIRGRIGSAYGTPQIGNLFVTPDGVNGNNTALDSQSTVGVDAGVDWTSGPMLSAGVTGFYEAFRNELVSQSPGPNLLNFTFNAPRSMHRGVEVTADWRPAPVALAGAHVIVAYTWDDQRYSAYVERLSTGAVSVAFDRRGNLIPGVTPHYLHVRAAYDHPAGVLRGLGAYIETNHRDAAFMDNANLLEAPGYTLTNINVHYDPEFARGRRAGLHVFVEIRNVTDQVYAASAANITNSLSAVTGLQNPAAVLANSGSIWAGPPRAVFAGTRVMF
jgi:iron complex outermembrane recepter protein